MIQSIRDAIEFFMIQRHSWQELARVVVGLFLPLIVMILWVLVHKQENLRSTAVAPSKTISVAGIADASD